MGTIRDVVANARLLPDTQTLYARRPWSPDSDAVIADEGHPPSGLDYLLEVGLVRDVLETWSKWRDGGQPSADEAARAVIHYAVFDTYQPVAGD